MRISRKLKYNMTYNTEQRNILLSFLEQNPDKMFSARQIESELENKNISRSAVYRNLAELKNDGKIKICSKNGGRQTFYQFYDIQSCKNHIHLSCTKCGAIFHMKNQLADSFIEELKKTEDFLVFKGDTTLYGICNKCSSEDNEVLK